MTPEAIQEAVAILERARLEGERIDVLPERCRPANLTDAYLVQEALNERLGAAGLGTVVGHKIGCTNPEMQKYIGVHEPSSGAVYQQMAKNLHGEFRHDIFVRPGVECEMAVRLGVSLRPERAPYSVESVADAVDTVMTAIEVVDDRYVDFRKVGAPTLVADDFFDAGCVLGPPVVHWRNLDLAALKGTLTVNGKLVSAGVSGNIMGHPFQALAWIANSFAARGKALKAGEFVLTGSIAEVIWVAPGDQVLANIEQLGSASVRF